VHILRYMQATQPDACVLRPTLREEARKAIGVWTPHTLSSLEGFDVPPSPVTSE